MCILFKMYIIKIEAGINKIQVQNLHKIRIEYNKRNEGNIINVFAIVIGVQDNKNKEQVINILIIDSHKDIYKEHSRGSTIIIEIIVFI